MKKLLLSTATVCLSTALPAAAATITGWDTSNVVVDTSNVTGVTGESKIYNATFNAADGPPATATTSGSIVFTPDEAVSPGIKVQPESYTDTGPADENGDRLALSGCLMTSSASTCTGEFQSGKRIKQEITGFEPVDLVFNLDNTDTSDTYYQVFGRLINTTGSQIDSFKVELGFGGAGEEFTLASGEQLSFSSAFTAQPNNSGKTSSTQFPFGLFGDAADSPNFLLDGFFANDRTGLELNQTSNTLTSGDYFGDYAAIFGDWNSQDDVPQGLFWDFDGNEETDALLMAWQIDDDEWQLRRDVGETCDDGDPQKCTAGVTLTDFETGTYAEILAELLEDGADASLFGKGEIEDLGNLNLNYALMLGDLTGYDQFTIRTTAFRSDTPIAPVPLPAGAPLLIAGLAMLGWIRRRRATC